MPVRNKYIENPANFPEPSVFFQQIEKEEYINRALRDSSWVNTKAVLAKARRSKGFYLHIQIDKTFTIYLFAG